MRPRSLAVLVIAAATASACHPKSLKTAARERFGGGLHVSTSDRLHAPVAIADRLTCPEAEGRLRRTAAAADGQSCTYASDTEEVTLARLAPGADGAAAALAPLRAQADALLPRARDHAAVDVVDEVGADGRKRTRVDLPFLHVRENGDVSDVKLLGISIHDEGGRHRRRTDGDEADAGPAAAGRANGMEYVYVLAGDPGASGGYHAAGYVARADAAGRMVAASFRSKAGHVPSTSEGVRHRDADLDALLDLNAPKR